MLNQHLSESCTHEVSHNLLGQKLGRKGQKTRERILIATLQLLGSSQDVPITLTSVAREAKMGMTALYPYFPDIGDLLLAALMRVMDSANADFVDRLRVHWPDESLGSCILDFLQAHYQFWQRHTRLLHIRNRLADDRDLRFIEYRNHAMQPIRDLLMFQMNGQQGGPQGECMNLATILMIGFERVATVLTNPIFHISAKTYVKGDEAEYIEQLIIAEAWLIELVIRQQREVARALVEK